MRRLSLLLALTTIAATPALLHAAPPPTSAPATAPRPLTAEEIFEGARQVQRQPTDEALRQGMSRLYRLAADALAEPGLDEAAFATLSSALQTELQGISAGRDFHSPEGRRLQWLLGDIVESVQMMANSPRLPVKRISLQRVMETLKLYGREYDHPGWEAAD